jgi:hypothetical protein
MLGGPKSDEKEFEALAPRHFSDLLGLFTG